MSDDTVAYVGASAGSLLVVLAVCPRPSWDAIPTSEMPPRVACDVAIEMVQSVLWWVLPSNQ